VSVFLRSFFSRKTAIRFVVGIASVIALLFALRAFENWRGERAWAAYRADAEKRGVHLSLMDFVPPAVPDAENFAAIPIFQEMFAARAAYQPFTSPFAWPEKWKGTAPPMANRFKGGRFDAVKWRDTLHDMHLLAQPTDDAARDILTGLASFEPALQQLRDAARRPHSRFPVHWEKSITASQPHFGTMLGASNLDTLRMNAHLALGESAAAYSDWLDGLALYRALEHEPTVITGLNRVTILLLLETAVWDGLAGRQWAEPELHALSADFASLNLLADLRFTLASERGMMNDSVDWLAALPLRERSGLFAGSISLQSPRTSAGGYVMGWLFPVGWFWQSQVKMNEVFDHRLAPLDVEHGLITTNPSSDGEIQALKARGIVAMMPYWCASILNLSFDGTEKKYLAEHTATQQARLACALELFRRAHGAFPERLDELVPDFLDAVPHDVMDGAPMRYRRNDGSFKLWSIALNRQDDAGETGLSIKPADQLDWVWHY
jgi:hypothetical protein